MQGFGNVGYYAAELFAEAGMKLVAISNSRGGVYNPAKGLDLTALKEHHQRTGALEGFPGSRRGEQRRAPGAGRATSWCPRPSKGQINQGQRRASIKAKFVVEGANGPTSPLADDILCSTTGIIMLPDILANAGGVTVSYFEWVQNIQKLFWTEDDVNRQLNGGSLLRPSTTCTTSTGKHKVNMRTAAYMLAIERVADAKRVRGIFP